MSDIISESERIRKAILTIVRDAIAEETKSCFRVYKAKVTSAPNGSTCGVQVLGDANTIDLPYSSKAASVTVGSFVWVATLYNSFSNAIVWETVDFK